MAFLTCNVSTNHLLNILVLYPHLGDVSDKCCSFYQKYCSSSRSRVFGSIFVATSGTQEVNGNYFCITLIRFVIKSESLCQQCFTTNIEFKCKRDRIFECALFSKDSRIIEFVIIPHGLLY